jgi:lipopolysaccharide export system permease protein
MLLSRYISKIIIGTILAVLLVLTGLEIFIEFTREFSDLGTGYYGWLQVLQYVSMLLPQNIYALFPMAGLIGSLIGLGILASNSELIVMRTSGVSVIEITWIVLKTALLMMVFMIFIGEILAPKIQHIAIVNKTNAISGGQTLMTKQGLWFRNKTSFLHVDAIMPDQHLKSILRYEFDGQRHLRSVRFAKEGFYDHDRAWVFKDVTETKFIDDKVVSNKFTKQYWDLSINPKLVGLTNINAEQKSLNELDKYIKYREKSGLNVDRYKLIFWQRVFQPLSILVMIFLSAPAILGFLRNKTTGLRIVIGSAFGLGFYVLNQFAGHFTMIYHLSPVFAAILPSMLFAAFGYFLLRRVR